MLSAAARYPFLLDASVSQSQPMSALNKIFAKGQINSASWSSNGWLKEIAPGEVQTERTRSIN